MSNKRRGIEEGELRERIRVERAEERREEKREEERESGTVSACFISPAIWYLNSKQITNGLKSHKITQHLTKSPIINNN